MADSQITPSVITKIAALAKLDLQESEITKFTPQLNEIFGYINQLSEVKTDEVPPTAQINEQVNIFRKDEDATDRGLSAAEAISQSKQTSQNFFVVPAVINNS